MRCAGLLLLLSLLPFSICLAGATDTSTKLEDAKSWIEFEGLSKQKIEQDQLNGISYVVSGSLAIVGGFVGQNIAQDPLEKGTYTLFQTIGIASLGYGAYVWTIGDDSRLMYDMLSENKHLNNGAKTLVLQSYFEQRKKRNHRERVIRAITHALVAGFNIYNGTQQQYEPVRNALYFVGGVNALASISFVF